MWSRLLPVLLVGCGRIAFDPASTPGDASLATDTSLAADAGIGFDITSPTCPLSDFTFVGNASCTPGAFELTPDAIDQAGAIWLTSPITIGPTTSFSIELTVEITQTSGNPGDGMTVVVQHDPRALAAVGGTGGQLGYENMKPSSAVELDTYLNPDDTFTNEVAIDVDGETVNEAAVAGAPFILSDGTPFHVWIDYSGNVIAVAIAKTATRPPTPLVTFTDDLSRLGTAWFGMTASTAGSRESHRVLRWKLSVTP